MSYRKLTQEELRLELVDKFGSDSELWSFECPNCHDVARAQDFRDAGADPNVLGQECIGRHLGALSGLPTMDSGRSAASRGCDWVAYGLFRGPWEIVMPSGVSVWGFPIAEVTEVDCGHDHGAEIHE